MSRMNNKIFKLRLKLLHLSNSIKYYFLDGIKVNVVSTSKYKNKRKEDLKLQKYLLKAGYHAKVVAWEDNEFADVNIIRSVWGYHNNIEEFKKYLEDNNTINTKEIILNNIDKKKQYELLETNNISRIETTFVNDISEYKYTPEKVVIKPVVSASGNNTFIVENPEDLERLKGINNLMIQKYIPGIKEGEISVVVINKRIQYGITRFPGVFTEYRKEEYIPVEKLEQEIVDTVNEIVKIEEYEKAVFMRIDFVKDENEYKVMEVELVDPDLFIETVPDEKLRKQVYERLVDSVFKFVK